MPEVRQAAVRVHRMKREDIERAEKLIDELFPPAIATLIRGQFMAWRIDGRREDYAYMNDVAQELFNLKQRETVSYVDIVFDRKPDHEPARFIEAEIDRQSVRFPWVDLPDGTAALRIAVSDEVADYRKLADKVIEAFNPPDEDSSEIAILDDAIDRVVRVLKEMPCGCPKPGTPGYLGEDEYCSWDACPPCLALGRWQGKDVSR